MINKKGVIMNKLLLALIMALLPVSSMADVWCKAKTGVVSVRPACKATETAINLGALGLQGPAGPAGAQGPAGPAGAQGPAGIGVSNAACAQADIAGNAWTFTFFDTLSNENDICVLAFDASGNLVSGASCTQTIGLSTIQVPVTQGYMRLGTPAAACGFGVSITKSTGSSWLGYATVDRTRSVLQGIAGIAITATTVRTNATMTGTRLGAVTTAQEMPLQLGAQQHELVRKALIGE